MAHVDDLIETGPEEVVVVGFLRLLGSHVIPRNRCFEGITNGLKNESKTVSKLQENHPASGRFLQFHIPFQTEKSSIRNGFGVLNGVLLNALFRVV
jgi:hypothetical protein